MTSPSTPFQWTPVQHRRQAKLYAQQALTEYQPALKAKLEQRAATHEGLAKLIEARSPPPAGPATTR